MGGHIAGLYLSLFHYRISMPNQSNWTRVLQKSDQVLVVMNHEFNHPYFPLGGFPPNHSDEIATCKTEGFPDKKKVFSKMCREGLDSDWQIEVKWFSEFCECPYPGFTHEYVRLPKKGNWWSIQSLFGKSLEFWWRRPKSISGGKCNRKSFPW